jgi:hypothetical protein
MVGIGITYFEDFTWLYAKNDATSSMNLGWEFRFLVPISGTPIKNGILILFLIPTILVGFFFPIPLLKNQEIGILIPKIGIPKKKNVGIQYTPFCRRRQSE